CGCWVTTACCAAIPPTRPLSPRPSRRGRAGPDGDRLAVRFGGILGVARPSRGQRTKRTGKALNDNRADWTEQAVLRRCRLRVARRPARRGGGSSIEWTGLDVRTQLIWAKSRFALGRGNYPWQHEPCWCGMRASKTAHWMVPRREPSSSTSYTPYAPMPL